MIKNTSFRELERYSRNDILVNLNVSEEIGKSIISRLLKSGILKVRNEPQGIDTEELKSSDIAVGELELSNYDRRYVFDYVGVIDLTIESHNFIINCFPKYIKRSEDTLRLEDMKPFVRTIERYNKAQQYTISVASEDDDRLQYNPLALALFLLRDYWEHGIYANTKEILEHNGTSEIEWESTISQTIPLLRNGRPFYVNYFTTESTTDESDYITHLHEYLLTKYSKHFKETGLDELFGIEITELYEGEQSDFGDDDYIEQRILKEINVQFVTQKQILLRAMYALIHKSGQMEEESGLSLYGTNTFHKVWENVCAEVFDSQLSTPIKQLSMYLADEYKNDTRTLQEFIPAPKWKNYKNKAEKPASKTLIPDYVSVYEKDGLSYFVIMDAKYYDISLPPELAGQPGVDDIDKQYLYQLAYKDFIEKHNLIPINAFLCPGDIATFDIAGEVEMPIFAGLNLSNIKVAILSAEKMLQAYLDGEQLDLQKELPDLFWEEGE